MIDGAKGARIRRFVQDSARAVDDPVPVDASPVWRAYLEAKREADEALRASGLDWTILRPGWLTDDPSRLRVVIGRDIPNGDISRGDVAAAIAAVLENDGTICKQWQVIQDGLMILEAIVLAVLSDAAPGAGWAGRR